MRAKRHYSWFERLLVLVGVICVGWWTSMTVHGWYFRSQQIALFDSLTRKSDAGLPPLPAPVKPKVVQVASYEPGGLIGVLDVPRLGISTPVISGDDEQALDVAVGHLADTPLPWEHGNSAVAAHRDGLFRSLEHVRYGDIVRVRTAHGDFDYEVRGTRIVEPDDLSVLKKGRTDSLTLITCYPFAYLGHAPQRFVVRAERLGVPAPSDLRTKPAAEVRATATPASVRARVTKPKPVKAATASKAPGRPSSRETLKSAAGSGKARKAAHGSRPSKPKDGPPKKRKWYRLFLG